VWGSALALVPGALWLWSGDPMWATIAAWYALINLFNLLPIAPLDGGRVMQAFAYSYSSGLGVALSLLGLVAAVALGTAFGFSLIWLVAALGAMELASEAQAHAGARALRLLPEPARFAPQHWLYLRGVVSGPGSTGAGEGMYLRSLERQERAASAAPLGKGQLMWWGLAYAALALALVLLVWTMRGVPGADLASRILE
jgi:Zn-dependent protease